MQKVKDKDKVTDVGDPKAHDDALEAAMRASLTPYERAELLLLVEIGKRLDILTAICTECLPKGRK
jgi:hypothetical protein